MSIVFITGGRGFIGRHVARACAASGDTVAGLGHGAWSPPEAAAWGVGHWINGDITPSNLAQLARAAGLPDVVIHLAGGSAVGPAIAQPREDFFRTVASTVELLEWLRQEVPQARLVVASSAAVYGAGHDGPIAEDAPSTPYSPYGFHKSMMEQLCRSYGATHGIRSSVARLFSAYGPALRKQLLWDACLQLHGGSATLALGGSGHETRDWVHVEDIAAILPALAQRATPDAPVVNVGTGAGTPVRDIAQALAAAWADAAGSAPATVSFSGRSRPGDPFSLVADTARLAALGLACRRPVLPGLAQYVRWFRQSIGAAA